MASETRMEQKVELYTLEQILARGVPEVRLEEQALGELAGYSALAGKKRIYLLGRQAEGCDIITGIAEDADSLKGEERVMGVLTSDPLALFPSYAQELPLTRQLEVYEDMREKPVEILEKDEKDGYLMLEEDIALKGPLEKLREAKRIASLFRLHYGYIGYLSDESTFCLGIYAKSEFSGDERFSQRHPYSISLSGDSGDRMCLEERAAEQPADGNCRAERPEGRRPAAGYVARMESYRSSLNSKGLPYVMRGLLEDIIATLTGKTNRGGKRVWFWRDRFARLEEITGSVEMAACGDSAAESLEELHSILKRHYYLRRRHPGLWEKAEKLLWGHIPINCQPPLSEIQNA